MSGRDGWQIADDYQQLDEAAKALGTHFSAPFMTLAFMTLLVIPSLKLSDKGLFDTERGEFISPVVKSQLTVESQS